MDVVSCISPTAIVFMIATGMVVKHMDKGFLRWGAVMCTKADSIRAIATVKVFILGQMGRESLQFGNLGVPFLFFSTDLIFTDSLCSACVFIFLLALNI